jgi:hypothetical protein
MKLLNLQHKMFSATVSESEIYDTVMSIATSVDGIPLSFIKLLLPLVLPVLTHIFKPIIVRSDFLEKWKNSVVLPVLKVGAR